MSTRIMLARLLITAIFFLGLSTTVSAQTKEDGIKLFEEAKSLQQNAQSNEDLKKAVEKYLQSLRIFETVNFRKGVGWAYTNVGFVNKNWGQYDKAVDFYEKALAIYRELKDRKHEGISLTGLGHVYYDWGRYDKAADFYEKALALTRELKDREYEGQCLNNLGNVYFAWGQYDKAVDFYEKDLAIARELEDRRGEGGSLGNLGIVYEAWGQYDRAVQFYEKDLAIRREFKDRKGEGNALNNLGNVYEAWGQYDKAVQFYEKDLAIRREFKDRKGEGNALNNLGNVYEAWGHYDRAVHFYEASLAISRELRNPLDEGHTLNNLGGVYQAWGQYDRAMECYEASLAISRERQDKLNEGRILLNIGQVRQHGSQPDKAEASFKQVLKIWESIKVRTGRPKNLLGMLYLDSGKIAKAEFFLKESTDWSSLGKLHLVRLDYEGARDYYETLRNSSEKNRNVGNLFTAYTGLGAAYEGLAEVNKAEEYFLRAVTLTEELRSNLPTSQRATFFDVRINGFLRTSPYDGLARVRLKLNRHLEAFKDSEYTKSRVFAEAMSKNSSEGKRFDIPSGVLKKDRELNDRLATLKKKRQVAYEKANQEVISVIEPQVEQLEKRFQANVEMLRDKYPLFAATKYPQPMDLDQTALKNDEWVLAYHVTDPGTIIYLTHGKKIVKSLFKPIPRSELEKLVQKFRKPLEITPGSDNFEDKLKSFDLITGKNLSDLLLLDILTDLPLHVPVIIVPDDSLGTLPFETLVLNDKGVVITDKDPPYVSGAEFFGDRNFISYSQSVTALTLSRIHAKGKGKHSGLLAIADPIYEEEDERVAAAPKKERSPTGPSASLYKTLGLMAAEKDGLLGLKFSRLPKTRQLALDLTNLYKGPLKICMGFDATKHNFLKNISPSLNHYDKVVFAAHGYFGKDIPGIMEPVLVLTLVPHGTDGYLRMTEVMRLKMNADIVALTACQTGLGKRTAGEGTMGMGRAFQYAGARSVLMSLWSVSEVTSVRLVKSFFRHMKEGKSKLEALSLAREEIKKRGFDHPFFWAGFILVGEAD